MKVERSHTPEEVSVHLAEIARLQNLGVFTLSELEQVNQFRSKLQPNLKPARSTERWFIKDMPARTKFNVPLPDGQVSRVGGLLQANTILWLLGAENLTEKTGSLAEFIYGENNIPNRILISSIVRDLKRNLDKVGWTISQAVEAEKLNKGKQGAFRLEKLTTKPQEESAVEVVPGVETPVDGEKIEELAEVVLPDGQKVTGETEEELLILMAVAEKAEKYEGLVADELAQILGRGVDKKFFKELDIKVRVLNQLLRDKGWKIDIYDIEGTQGRLKCLRLLKVQNGNGVSLEERPDHVKNKQERIVSEIDIRDKEARQRTQGYLDRIREVRLSFPITGATLNRSFGRLTGSKVKSAVEKGFISPSKDHDGHIRLTLEETLIILHWTDSRNPLRSRFDAGFAEGYQMIAEEENKKYLLPKG